MNPSHVETKRWTLTLSHLSWHSDQIHSRHRGFRDTVRKQNVEEIQSGKERMLRKSYVYLNNLQKWVDSQSFHGCGSPIS